MKEILIAFLSIFISIDSLSQKIDLVKTKVNKNITWSIPANFIPVPDTEIRKKYISARGPIAAYTDLESHQIDWSISESVTRWKPQDVELIKSFFKSSILNLYDSVKILSEGIRIVGKNKFIYFEFLSLLGTNGNAVNHRKSHFKYFYLHYVIYQKRTLLFNFSCPTIVRNRWNKTVPGVIESIKLR